MRGKVMRQMSIANQWCLTFTCENATKTADPRSIRFGSRLCLIGLAITQLVLGGSWSQAALKKFSCLLRDHCFAGFTDLTSLSGSAVLSVTGFQLF